MSCALYLMSTHYKNTACFKSFPLNGSGSKLVLEKCSQIAIRKSKLRNIRDFFASQQFLPPKFFPLKYIKTSL